MTGGLSSSGCCSPAGGGAAVVSSAPAATGPGPGADVIWFKGGRSEVGTRWPAIPGDGEGPVRNVRLQPFGLERFAVTAAQFANFVAATGYVTDAERFGWSFVFRAFLPPEEAAVAPQVPAVPWWARSDGADWRHPDGPSSDLSGKSDHPVTHVSWNDAAAYAGWRGGRLPTEAEWEHAARPNSGAAFPWGDDEPTDEKLLCNIWQGRFPEFGLALDGFAGTAPVDSFKPSVFGMYNMVGNVWEWCSGSFRVRSVSRQCKARDAEAVAAQERTLKGGSYLCHKSYCFRYRIAARMGRPPDTSTGHIGLRVAFDSPKPALKA